MSEIKKETHAQKWKDFKRGDHVVVNNYGSDDNIGRKAICIADSTTTGFGHKHVELQFDDNGQGTALRTYELDLVLSWEDFAKSIGRTVDSRGVTTDVEHPFDKHERERGEAIQQIDKAVRSIPRHDGATYGEPGMPDFGRKSA